MAELTRRSRLDGNTSVFHLPEREWADPGIRRELSISSEIKREGMSEKIFHQGPGLRTALDWLESILGGGTG